MPSFCMMPYATRSWCACDGLGDGCVKVGKVLPIRVFEDPTAVWQWLFRPGGGQRPFLKTIGAGMALWATRTVMIVSNGAIAGREQERKSTSRPPRLPSEFRPR